VQWCDQRRALRLAGFVLWMLSGCGADQPESVAGGGLSGLRVSTVLGAANDAEYLRADQPRTFSFPQDHLAHPGFRSEWWYFTAWLTDAEGYEYGMQFTLFRQALTSHPVGEGPWQTGQAYLGHFAITDVASASHHAAQRFARGHPQLAGSQLEGGWSVYIDDWSLRQQPAEADFNFQLNAQQHEANGDRFAARLNVMQVQPIVLQGERGLSRKSAESGSYYYSMPRLEVSGRLSLPDRSVTVTGSGWLDREWSTSLLAQGVAGWDWFALQLADGRSVMAFQLRRRDGRRDGFDHGLVVSPGARAPSVIGAGDPGVDLLRPEDYRLQAQRWWQDQQGVRWPVSWILSIGDERFEVEALIDDQVMDTAIIYWEGIVGVRDEAGNDVGRGYMELTGYQ